MTKYVVVPKNWQKWPENGQKWPKMALNGWDKWDKPPGRSYPTYIHPYKAKKTKKINFALPVIPLCYLQPAWSWRRYRYFSIVIWTGTYIPAVFDQADGEICQEPGILCPRSQRSHHHRPPLSALSLGQKDQEDGQAAKLSCWSRPRGHGGFQDQLESVPAAEQDPPPRHLQLRPHLHPHPHPRQRGGALHPNFA